MLQALLSLFRWSLLPEKVREQPQWKATGYRCIASHMVNTPAQRRLG
jgi:hypothetical protein